MDGACSTYEFRRKLEGKKLRRRPSHKWENNIKEDMKETECDGEEWSHMAQDKI
jgi:hypothetical protein